MPPVSATVTADFETVTPRTVVLLTVTATESAVTLLPQPVTECETVALRSASATTLSSTPVTVTVCGTFQLDVVNDRELGEVVATPVLLLAGVTVTLPPGRALSTTVYVSDFFSPTRIEVREASTSRAVVSFTVTVSDPTLTVP